MKPLTFADLARLPVVQQYESAFYKATGVPLKLTPPEAPCSPGSFGPGGNRFCARVASIPAGCAACLETEARLQRSVARKRALEQAYCYAGLTVVAMPVEVGRQHVATLLSGRVLRREPTERDFTLVLKMLGGGPDAAWVQQARKSYLDVPVLTAERFQAILQLLSVFAQYLADFAERHALACSKAEPEAVAGAKRFVHSHVEEPITLTQVVRHVHVSRFYFCKLFKKATGMTLTQYVSRVRVEKAKALLLNPSLRISEVVFAAGFGSVARFNYVFKGHVGMAPGEYRASAREQLAV
jgi:AraC-like DNA-binding protein/ligand-binding sensor protein